jgi:hypothetical protein
MLPRGSKTSNWMAWKQESGGGVFIGAGSHQLLFRCFKLLTNKLYEVNNISEAMGQTAQGANTPGKHSLTYGTKSKLHPLCSLWTTGFFVFTQQPFQNWLIITSSFITSSFEVVHWFFKRKFQSGSKPLNMIHLFHQLFKKNWASIHHGLLYPCIFSATISHSEKLSALSLNSIRPIQRMDRVSETQQHEMNFKFPSPFLLNSRMESIQGQWLSSCNVMSSVVTTFNVFRHSWELVYWLGLWWSF